MRSSQIQSKPVSHKLCGDFNTSFERNTAQTKSLNSFIEVNSMRVGPRLMY